MKKKLTLMLSTTAIITLSVFLLIMPGALPADEGGTASVTRMYGENFEGPWSATPSENTKYILEISSTNGITAVIIQEVVFLWESPEGTFVFQGVKGSKGKTGPRGYTGTMPVAPTG